MCGWNIKYHHKILFPSLWSGWEIHQFIFWVLEFRASWRFKHMRHEVNRTHHKSWSFTVSSPRVSWHLLSAWATVNVPLPHLHGGGSSRSTSALNQLRAIRNDQFWCHVMSLDPGVTIQNQSWHYLRHETSAGQNAGTLDFLKSRGIFFVHVRLSKASA